jgi:hypothetical protein
MRRKFLGRGFYRSSVAFVIMAAFPYMSGAGVEILLAGSFRDLKHCAKYV